MMDSQENALLQGEQQEVKAEETAAQQENDVAADKTSQVNETTETAEEAAESTVAAAEERKVYQSKKEVLERVKEIAHAEEVPQKDEVEYLKTTFYKLHIAEREEQQKAYLEAGGDPNTYVVTPDEDEEAFKAEMGIIKEKRQQLFREQEQEKQQNLERKLAIIEQIKSMVTSPEEANQSYKEFKALQEEWKEIKAVPAERANELWRTYQLYVEQFYDLLKLNSEAREYDFRKNLELKTSLCEAAERLADEPDVISAFHPSPRNCARRYGHASRTPLPSSTSATSSTSRTCVPARRRTWSARPPSARRPRPSLPRRTRAAPTGSVTPRRSWTCRPSGRPSVSHPRR